MSDYLFARPGLMSGLARALDLTGTFDDYNESPNGDIADLFAMLTDWRGVDHDLLKAIESYQTKALAEGHQLALELSF